MAEEREGSEILPERYTCVAADPATVRVVLSTKSRIEDRMKERLRETVSKWIAGESPVLVLESGFEIKLFLLDLVPDPDIVIRSGE